MDHDHSGNDGWSSPRAFTWVLCAFIVIAAFFLITEHRAHAFGYLPFLLLLACPLLHMFMHGGHDEHGGRTHDSVDGTGGSHQHPLNPPPDTASKKESAS